MNKNHDKRNGIGELSADMVGIVQRRSELDWV